ncbi:hypothetical protein RHMOL_Rhmol11G0071900 [Rhododendron molle]|uniref:Uncharacterized protein n=1 Tax=Rhododendron molle TaxID=49168 RepID=A0ACC0LPN1_RHOML|nr:hypothetical protein RHMOL_Rhmol11G0071900 [Rhododendron molle]
MVVRSKLSRELIAVFLKPNAVQSFVPAMDRVARELVRKEWEPMAGREVVVYEMAKKYTFELACQLLAGIEDPEHWAGFHDRFASVLAGITSVPIDFPGTTFSKAIKDARFLRKKIGVIIKEGKSRLEKEENPSIPDLVSGYLLTPDENGKFRSVDDTAEKILGIMIGAFETTSMALTFTIKISRRASPCLSRGFQRFNFSLPTTLGALHEAAMEGIIKISTRVLDPNTQFSYRWKEWAWRGCRYDFGMEAIEIMEIAKAKGPGELLTWGDIQKMRYTWNVVCETMRLAPPAQIAFKEALTDFTFAGYTIPKGWKICWSFHSTHKDPAYFPNPEEFDPTRFEGNGPTTYTYVPFGGGNRMCLGKEYARQEILVFIYNLVKKFHRKKLIPNDRVVFKSPENGLPICLTAHET